MPLKASLKAQRQLLALILRGLRQERRASARDVAAAMGLPLRSYYNFEAGRMPLDLAMINRFAEAIDCDAASILFALSTGDKNLPFYCCDNKFVTLNWLALKGFSDAVGGQIAALPVTGLMENFKKPFEAFSTYLSRRDQSAEQWLRANQSKLFWKGFSDKD